MLSVARIMIFFKQFNEILTKIIYYFTIMYYVKLCVFLNFKSIGKHQLLYNKWFIKRYEY